MTQLCSHQPRLLPTRGDAHRRRPPAPADEVTERLPRHLGLHVRIGGLVDHAAAVVQQTTDHDAADEA